MTLIMAMATPAMAQDQTSRHDVRCLAIGLSFAAEKKRDLQRIGIMTSFFFLGRLNAAAPGTDLTRELRAEAAGMSDEEFQSEGEKCLEEFTVASNAMNNGADAPMDPRAN